MTSFAQPAPFTRTVTLTHGAILLGALLLAAEPALWLLGTWYRDGYEGIGWLAFVLVAGVALWSGTSAAREQRRPRTRTYLLLLVTAAIRLAAQLLDVNVVGALLLAVDVYALALLGGLQYRERAISPFWLAALFCFSLPVEPMLQRVLGYDLQQISAWLACGLLQPFFAELSCAGVRLRVQGVDVLVDLPCSGTQLMSLTALLFALINTLRMPDLRTGLLGALVCVALALLGNGVRIAVLAAGIASAGQLPFSVMDPLPHTLIGLLTVALSSLVLLVFSLRRDRAVRGPEQRRASATVAARAPRPWFGFGFLFLALLIGAVQPQPVDAFPRHPPPEIPLVAAGFLRQDSALTAQEISYFTRYGGGARRASFGPFGLLLVSTGSPLRHLHDPMICLRGAGYRVRLLGTDHATSSTVYRAERAGDGEQARYVVRVSYLSDSGRLATSVSEAVRHWLREPGSRWTMVQRIVPDHPGIDPDRASAWEAAMRRAFNLT